MNINDLMTIQLKEKFEQKSPPPLLFQATLNKKAFSSPYFESFKGEIERTKQSLRKHI